MRKETELKSVIFSLDHTDGHHFKARSGRGWFIRDLLPPEISLGKKYDIKIIVEAKEVK